MSATAPLLAGHAADSVVTWLGARPVTAAQFCGAARARAAALPSSRHAINLCEDAATFMLAAAAAWLRGQAIVLPPDRLVRTLARMKRDFPDSYCLCDGAQTESTSRECGFAVVRADVAIEEANAWPPPEIALVLEAAILHTSGSTGEPSRHRKSWRELVGGARMLAAALGSPSTDAAVVGTVQPQHMYGLETTIMFPLQCGGRLLPVRPALPGEVGDAVHVARSLGVASMWLFTTPLQLRAFHAAGHVDGIVRVVTATMPLDLELARRIEHDWHARVDEIYGCTEGGTLAFRRPTQTDVFTGGQGVHFAVDDAGKAAVVASHLREPIALADRVELVDSSAVTTSRRVRLLGRDDDLVKVGGKRASLAGLTATLTSLPGVVDGAFFFPTDDARRLCAVVVAPEASPLQIRTALAAVIDGAFLPRPLVFVDAIPRTASQKAPLASLRALVASRKQQAAGAFVTEARFDRADPVFAGHFPGRPIVPGVLLIERVEATLAQRGRRMVEVGSVKFLAAALPEETLAISVACDASGDARFEIVRETTLVASGVCKTVAA